MQPAHALFEQHTINIMYKLCCEFHLKKKIELLASCVTEVTTRKKTANASDSWEDTGCTLMHAEGDKHKVIYYYISINLQVYFLIFIVDLHQVVMLISLCHRVRLSSDLSHACEVVC